LDIDAMTNINPPAGKTALPPDPCAPQEDPHRPKREPVRSPQPWDWQRNYPHCDLAFPRIRFIDPKTPEHRLPAGHHVSELALSEYARRLAGALMPHRGNIEVLLAIAGEMAAERRPVEPLPVLVNAILPSRYPTWAQVTLDAICSEKFETLESTDRERLARLHALFVKLAPIEHTGGAETKLRARLQGGGA
jgi:hypothetical protein